MQDDKLAHYNLEKAFGRFNGRKMPYKDNRNPIFIL